MITPVILSGGSGTRLWPISRAALPKQFHALTADKTMLQMTALRTAGEGYAPPIVVTNSAHLKPISEQLEAIGVTPGHIILEPLARNTAPAIALAALAAPDDALLLVVPCDHVIADVPAFDDAVGKALGLAQAGWLVTFGLKPTHPETGYGYIRQGQNLAEGVFRAERFVEKPDRATAETYVKSGSYFWNGGIFLFKASAYLRALSEHAPELLDRVKYAFGGGSGQGNVFRPDADRFGSCPAVSIDYAVMEKSDNVAVVPVAMGWSDVGSWDALHELSAKESDANSTAGPAVLSDSAGCMIRSTGPLVAGIGLENLIVIATADAVVILPRGRSQDIKLLTEELKSHGYGGLL